MRLFVELAMGAHHHQHDPALIRFEEVDAQVATDTEGVLRIVLALELVQS